MKGWAKKINWLWAAGGFTAAYLVGAAMIVGPCRAWLFVTTGVLNEVGDFLAGVFSPLAFIWLVAAVLTQRQELVEAREQFAKGQGVIDGQMKNITAQNALLSDQHIQAQNNARQTYKLNLFDKRFEIYNELLVLHKSIEEKQILGSEFNDLERIAKKSSFVFSNDVSDHLDHVVEEAIGLLAYEDKYFSAFDSDERSGIPLPADPESVKIRQAYAMGKLRLQGMIDLDSLNELMWKSMRVSDD